MLLTGKGWFIWQVSRCERGKPAAIAERAVSSGATHVLIKIAERTHAYGLDRSGRDTVAPVVTALRGRGLQVWGWHYVYGEQPLAEAEIAVERCVRLGLDGYVVDAEAEYRQPGKSAAAQRFMATLRAGLPLETPIALSSYRYPRLHRMLPWRAFLEHCDLAMPQVYWEQAHNPAQQLDRCVREYSDPDLVGHVRPIVPTGAAYAAGGWRPAPEDLASFMREAQRLRLPAANFYSWDYAGTPGQADLWEAVAEYEWQPTPTNLDASDAVQRYFKALNSGSLERVLDCYQPNAALVTADRTRYPREALTDWHRVLLADLRGAVFTLQSLTGSGNTRHARWTAIAPHAQILDGEDTFGIVGGLIQYHATRFILTATPDALAAEPASKRLPLSTAWQYL
jgi:hypothetical protein